MRWFNTTRVAIAYGFALVTTAMLAAQDTAPQQILGAKDMDSIPARIAFGSCSNQDKDQPVLNTVVQQSPDLFVYLGDNIYGDTRDMDVLAAKYRQLGDKAEFQALRANVPVLSVWDDHDYGWNDAGKEYPFKHQSKQIFMDFWAVPQDSPRRGREGIYGAHLFSSKGMTLQIILLDTRTFRDSLKRNETPIPDNSGFKNDYQPDHHPGKTLLGTDQWKWLESQLKRKADLRIICSSIQFGHEYNGWESWTNLPHEQQRMVELIKNTGAEGVVFISGDVHWAEISRRDFQGLYPLYDVTASGLTEDWYNFEPNKYRVGNPFRENHFGMLEIDWKQQDPTIDMKIIDVAGTTQVAHQVRLSELSSAQHVEQPNFQENKLLPPVFQQLAIPRPDGSQASGFVGNFENSLQQRKPLLIFLDGSGAHSQFSRIGDQIGYGLFGLLAQKYHEQFHVAAVEKRGVQFGESVQRPGSAEGASDEYQRHATLDDRASDVRLLLDQLLQADFVDPAKVLLVGHSEGADVAAAVAARDNRVTHVAFLSGGGAPQFFDFFVLRRKAIKEQGATSQEIEDAMSRLEQEIRDVLQDPQSIDQFWLGHAHRRWSTFATASAASNLVESKAKLFIAHGSDDQSVPIESFDFLVISLLAAGRNDVSIHRYPGRDHSFTLRDSPPGYEGFLEVVDQIIQWSN